MKDCELRSWHQPRDEAIYAILEYFGKSLNGERTYIFEKNKKGGDDNTYEWVAEGVKPEKDNLQNLPPGILRKLVSQISERKAYRISGSGRNQGNGSFAI